MPTPTEGSDKSSERIVDINCPPKLAIAPKTNAEFKGRYTPGFFSTILSFEERIECNAVNLLDVMKGIYSIEY